MLFDDVKSEYRKNWQSFNYVRGGAGLAANVADRLIANKRRYLNVQRFTGVPWFWIAITHNRESNADFTTHLHNGDPLNARTVHVPAGRPVSGNPPFSWEQSAIDAIAVDGYTKIKDWSLERMLFSFEGYNGWGYRSHGIQSPYLWSYTDRYSKGKYISDGKWSSSAVDAQMGCVVLLVQMAKRDPSIKLHFENSGTTECLVDPMVGR
jgi:lysozyme family protein